MTRKDILSHHDVVFLNPVHDPAGGLPIGTGDTGALLWTESDRLHVTVNKTDLWDDTVEDDPVFANHATEKFTVCRHGAHIVLDMNCPAFEMLYQDPYEARISLYDATARISANAPFMHTEVEAFACEGAEAVVLHLRTAAPEAMPLSMRLERFGSRMGSYWFHRFRPGTDIGLGGTSSEAEDGILRIRQSLRGTEFCVSLLTESSAEANFSAIGSHGSRCDFTAAQKQDILVYIAIGTGKTADEAAKEADRRVRSAAAKGRELLRAEHNRAWAEFWEKSYVTLPESQDFLENLWYLNLYYANSQMKGVYPAHFCNGLWSFYHDYVPWTDYFHYNMQLATFPLEAAGHPELLETYCGFRVRQLPLAKKYAEVKKGTGGAFYADVCDRQGRGGAGVSDNCTCGAQIAMMLYRHYRYSGDRKYLEEAALPVMRECAQFYMDILQKGEDGFYHVHSTQGYEGSPVLDDSITDLAMIRALFSALIRELPAAETEELRDRLENLTPYRYTGFYPEEICEGKITRGIGNGLSPRGEEVLLVGQRVEDGQWIRRTFGDRVHDYYGFPDTEMAPLFPAGEIGIRNDGEKLYNAIYNSVLLHHRSLFPDNALGRDASDGFCMGWCMQPIYLARMGLWELLKTQFENTITTWIAFPQGFGFYSPEDRERLRDRWAQYEIIDCTNREKHRIPAWNWRHFDYETVPILATAVNEMLLQSYDGTMRLFCAVDPAESYAFCLYAEGGFRVEGRYAVGKYAAEITSLRGSELRLALPAGEYTITDAAGAELPVSRHETGELIIETCPGMILRVANCEKMPQISRKMEKNNGPKVFGDAKLGEFAGMYQ